MNRLSDPPKRHDVVMIPIIWVAVVLSILVHIAALWLALSRSRPLSTDAREQGRASTPLAVQLAPRATPPASASPAPSPPTLALRAAPRTVVRPPRAKPAPPRPALSKAPAQPLTEPEKSTPRSVVPEAPVTPEPAPKAVPPPAEDLAAYIEARRRARGEPATPTVPDQASAPAESERERRNRIVAANLGLDRTPTFGRDPRNAGGMFEIRELNYDNAEFDFFGFDKDIGRKAKQRFEVRKGNNSDIRIAVVRKMISIIRENVSGDFSWVSQRLGRQVTLSARPGDNAELEDFILHDIFPDARRP